MTRLGINCVFNVGAMEWNKKHCPDGARRRLGPQIVLRRRRKQERRGSVPSSGTTRCGCRSSRPEETNLYDMRLVRHEDGWIYGLFCAERHDDSKPDDLSAAIARCGIARTKDLVEVGTTARPQNPLAAPAQLRAAPGICGRQVRVLHAANDRFRRHRHRRRHRLGTVRRHRERRDRRREIIDPRFYHTIKEGKNGLGPAPIKTEKGWLHLAHGVRNTAAGMRYVLYLFLCDLNDPRKLIKSPGGYFMAPEGDERVGDVSNVLFANGWVVAPDGDVFIYYGSSDTRTHVATSTVDKLLDHLLNSPEDGLRSSVCIRQRCELIRNNERLKSRRK